MYTYTLFFCIITFCECNEILFDCGTHSVIDDVTRRTRHHRTRNLNNFGDMATKKGAEEIHIPETDMWDTLFSREQKSYPDDLSTFYPRISSLTGYLLGFQRLKLINALRTLHRPQHFRTLHLHHPTSNVISFRQIPPSQLPPPKESCPGPILAE